MGSSSSCLHRRLNVTFRKRNSTPEERKGTYFPQISIGFSSDSPHALHRAYLLLLRERWLIIICSPAIGVTQLAGTVTSPSLKRKCSEDSSTRKKPKLERGNGIHHLRPRQSTSASAPPADSRAVSRTPPVRTTPMRPPHPPTPPASQGVGSACGARVATPSTTTREDIHITANGPAQHPGSYLNPGPGSTNNHQVEDKSRKSQASKSTQSDIMGYVGYHQMQSRGSHDSFTSTSTLCSPPPVHDISSSPASSNGSLSGRTKVHHCNQADCNKFYTRKCDLRFVFSQHYIFNPY